MIALHVNGTPRPKQSVRWVAGRAVSVAATRKLLKLWTAAIIAECKRYLRDGDKPLCGPVAVTMTFYFACKDSIRHGSPHTSRPDADNLAKAVLDALQAGGVLADDANVADARQTKLWAPSAGAVIHLRAFGAAEPRADQDEDLGASAIG